MTRAVPIDSIVEAALEYKVSLTVELHWDATSLRLRGRRSEFELRAAD